MSQDTFIIFGDAMTQAVAVPALIESHIVSNGGLVHRNDFSFTETPPASVENYDDWFYNHWVINTATTSTHVICIDNVPNYESVRLQYPEAKLITVTYTVDEIPALAKSIYNGYYVRVWNSDQTEHEMASERFQSLISPYPQWFPDVTISPADLTEKQKMILFQILSYQLLLKNYHSLVLPEDNNHFEIKMHEILYQPAIFKSKLLSILGTNLSYAASVMYNQLLKNNFTVIFDRYTN